jgi:ribonuclease P protein component
MVTAVHPARGDVARPQLWRITDRRTFAALAGSGRRARRGPLRVTWLPATEPGTPPRAAFAIARGAGGAVLRNRIRRRLRAALRTLAADGRLPSGSYLLAGGAPLATMAWPELLDLVGQAIAEVQR